MAALAFLSGPAAGLRYEITGQLTLGRSRACDVALDDDQVSRQHARIEHRQGGLAIRDLGSRNGTRVNGQRINSQAALLDGDRIQLGASIARLELEDTAAAPTGAGQQRRSFEALLVDGEAPAPVLSLSADLLAAPSPAHVLRTAARFAARSLQGVGAGFLVRGGIAWANAEQPVMPAARALLQQAVDRGELVFSGRMLCIPLVRRDRERFGALALEREGELTEAQWALAAGLGRLAAEALGALRLRAAELPTLLGASPNYRRMLERAAAAAVADERVTLFGEAGTGRSAVARYLHACSPRAWGPLVTVNCAAPGELEDALRADDSGAEAKSALLRAEGGTLVLRHLELLPRALGQRLARWMAQRRAPSLGEGERVDPRTIAIARDPLDILAARRRLPSELAEALSGVAIEVPALRERSADAPALFHFFAHERSRRLGREPPRLSADAKRALTAYAWPGNLTELRLLAERLALTCAGLEISPARLPAELLDAGGAAKAPTLQARVRALERAAIAEALSSAGGKKIRAAQLLGISRPTLDKKLKELHLTWAPPAGGER